MTAVKKNEQQGKSGKHDARYTMPQHVGPAMKSEQSSNGNGSVQQTPEQKIRCLKNMVITAESGTIYSFDVEEVREGYKFSEYCDRKASDGTVERLEHYAYVSPEDLKGLAKKLRGLSRDKAVFRSVQLLGQIRQHNYKGSGGRMVYITPDGLDVIVSKVSENLPDVRPKYIDANGTPQGNGQPSPAEIYKNILNGEIPVETVKKSKRGSNHAPKDSNGQPKGTSEEDIAGFLDGLGKAG